MGGRLEQLPLRKGMSDLDLVLFPIPADPANKGVSFDGSVVIRRFLALAKLDFVSPKSS
jgi:hypothetical protein